MDLPKLTAILVNSYHNNWYAFKQHISYVIIIIIMCWLSSYHFVHIFGVFVFLIMFTAAGWWKCQAMAILHHERAWANQWRYFMQLLACHCSCYTYQTLATLWQNHSNGSMPKCACVEYVRVWRNGAKHEQGEKYEP